jgi:hypothetical protein
MHRTLLAATVYARGKRPNKRHGCRRLAARFTLTADELRYQVGGSLLELLRKWHWIYKEQLPRGAARHLQQDIKRAIDFIDVVTGERTNTATRVGT